jgi:predicted transcriptional regulator
MQAALALRSARRRAGLSQRNLATRTGVPQSTIGRIESGATDPRVGTLTQLFHACGATLEVEKTLGLGVDRTQLARLIAMSLTERLQHAVSGAQPASHSRRHPGQERLSSNPWQSVRSSIL